MTMPVQDPSLLEKIIMALKGGSPTAPAAPPNPGQIAVDAQRARMYSTPQPPSPVSQALAQGAQSVVGNIADTAASAGPALEKTFAEPNYDPVHGVDVGHPTGVAAGVELAGNALWEGLKPIWEGFNNLLYGQKGAIMTGETPSGPTGYDITPTGNPGLDKFLASVLGGGTTSEKNVVSTSLGSGGSAGAPDALSEDRKRLQDRIDNLAKLSSLPDLTFKERLAHLLVGMADGYSRAYLQTGSGRRALPYGIAQGAVAVEKAKDERTQENKKRELFNIGQQDKQIGFDTNIYKADTEAASRVNAARIKAEATLRAAKSTSNDPLKRIELALKARELYNGLLEDQNKSRFDNVDLQLPNGQKIKVGMLGPAEKTAAVAATQAPVTHPEVWKNFIAVETKKMQDSGEDVQLAAKGEKPSAVAVSRARASTMQFFLEHPEEIPKAIGTSSVPTQITPRQ